MRRRFKSPPAVWLALLCLLFAGKVNAQQSPVRFSIYINDPNLEPTVTNNGQTTVVTFADQGANAIAANYVITGCERMYPSATHDYLKHYWTFTASSTQLMGDLLNYNTAFSDGKVLPVPMVLCGPNTPYTPNDYGHDMMGYQPELTLINAKGAYGRTHGSPSTVIGITDTYFDLRNPDIAGKFALMRTNFAGVGVSIDHGTASAGCAAGATDNNLLLASIGFNCRLDGSSNLFNDDVMKQMSDDGDKILNGSWLNNCTWSLGQQMIYDEIYENGTIACFGAGNGPGYCSGGYCFPASLNHNMSVSSVGYDATPGVLYNRYDAHDRMIPPDGTSHQANDKVDICAAGYNVHLLVSPERGYVVCSDGTSFASPTVAGACGLLHSMKPYLSPYQLEYIIKKSARNVYGLAVNAPYIGKMGAGTLDADAATCLAQDINVNAPETQTMEIAGVEVNTHCAPGYASNGVNPVLRPVIVNGTAPFTYEWYELSGNTTTLDNYNSANPQVLTSSGSRLLYYYLIVKDASDVQKVASKYIKMMLTTDTTYDLVTRDSYADMFDERNMQTVLEPRDWNIWKSPDVWNRKNPDGVIKHEDPEYYGPGIPNYAYVRVRNVGCRNSPATAGVRLYWTLASTGEDWTADWTITNIGIYPAGREITNPAGLPIPVLQPGQFSVLANSWQPVKPENYNPALHNVDVCFLARVIDGHNVSDPSGMTIPEVGYETDNVYNNNNIATRNFIVNNKGASKSTHGVFVANPKPILGTFNLNISTDKYINHHFAGDISQLVSISLTLPPTLYQNWVQNGAQGNYTSMQNNVINFNCTDFMQLKGFTLAPGQKELILVTFNILDSTSTVTVPELHFVEEMVNQQGPNEVMGDVTFAIHSGAQSVEPELLRPSSPTAVTTPKEDKFIVYPNPSTGIFYVEPGKYTGKATLTVTDIAGSLILTRSGNFDGKKETINMQSYPAGVYNLKIEMQDGSTQVSKLVKQ